MIYRYERIFFILTGLLWGEFLPSPNAHAGFWGGLLCFIIGILPLLHKIITGKPARKDIFIEAMFFSIFILLLFIPYPWKPEARLAILSFFLLGRSTCPLVANKQSSYWSLGWTFLFSAFFLLAWRGLPGFQESICSFSRVITSTFSTAHPAKRMLSFSISGLAVWMIFFLLTLFDMIYMLGREEEVKKQVLVKGGIKVVCCLLTWAICFRWGSRIVNGMLNLFNMVFYSIPEGVTIQVKPFSVEIYASSLCMLCTGIIFDFFLPLVRSHHYAAIKRENKKRLLHQIFISAALLLSCFCILAGYYPENCAKVAPIRKNVVLAKGALADIAVPDFTRFGIANGGMFGMLPRYLLAQHYTVRAITLKEWLERQPLTDILIIINPNEPFTPGEIKQIYSFVHNGGSLLVMGDHTDLMGIQKPLNTLLTPVGIRFEFDSAFTESHWYHAYETFPGYLTLGLDKTNERLQQGTGASLNIVSPGKSGDVLPNKRYAIPAINGKYAFSDTGDYKNKNAYLGNYIYECGESAGDLCLTAYANYGKGKVMVFGDTSMFQNVAMPRSLSFVSRVFALLSGTAPIGVSFLGWDRVHWFALSLFLLLPGVCLSFIKRQLAFMLPLVIPLALASLLLLTPLEYQTYAVPALDSEEYPLAIIDAAHINKFNLKHWTVDSLSGLTTNLARNNFLPVLQYTPLMEKTSNNRKAALYILVAPLKDISVKERTVLLNYLEEGGTVFLATGWHESLSTPRLFTALNIQLLPIPLGPQPIEATTEDITQYQKQISNLHFLNLWPWEEKNGQQTIHKEAGYPVVIERSFKRGRLIAVGDAFILLDKGLEQEQGYLLGNILWFKKLLDQFIVR